MINILYHMVFVKRFTRKICVFSVILCVFHIDSILIFLRLSGYDPAGFSLFP